LINHYLGPRAAGLTPSLQRRLPPDFLEVANADHTGRLDVSAAGLQLSLQRGVLAPLMSERLAERLLDNRDKTTDLEPHPLLPQEVHQRLMKAIWVLPASKRQRDLQLEHVNRLAALWLRPTSARAEVRAVVWQQTQQLHVWLRRASNRTSDASTRAHLSACLDTLQSAMRASVVRVGV
jgi:hypothetical protein